MHKILLYSKIASLACAQIANAETTSKPNIVYILADDMGYGDVSYLNPQSKLNTVNIDRLAESGISFNDAHTTSAVCSPSRYGIMTGRYCWRTWLKRGVTNGASPYLIDPSRLTVAQLLKNQGYNTACIGKWHMGMTVPSTTGSPVKRDQLNTIDWNGKIQNGPNANGFDYYYGLIASLDMPPYIYVENQKFLGKGTTEKAFFRRKGPATEEFDAVNAMEILTQKTVDYIEQQKGNKPFFIYMPLTAPHTPLVPSKNFQGKSGLGDYGDLCLEVDWSVGEVIKALDRKGLSDDTMVVFTSDNGCAGYLDIEDMKAKGHNPSHIFRGFKASIWEGGHRVPFIVKWPRIIKPQQISDETISLSDFMATAAELTGQQLPYNAGEDSISFLNALKGKKIDRSKRAAIVHHSSSGFFAIRKGKWKLKLCHLSGSWIDDGKDISQIAPIQLYNMETDKSETTSLHKAHPEVVDELKKLLKKYINEGRSTSGKRQQNDTPLWEDGLFWMQ